MTTRRGIIVGLVACALLLTYCVMNNEASYRFRMTAEVETPHGLRHASSVYEVEAHRIWGLTAHEARGSGSLTGEALIIDLPDGPIFVTLKMPVSGDGLDGQATAALAPEDPRGNIDRYLSTVRKLGSWFGGAKAELPREDWPMMVRFRNINDPRSGEEMDPKVIGVNRIILETTSAPVTTEIEQRIPWLKDAKSFRYNGMAYGDPYPLPYGYFKQ